MKFKYLFFDLDLTLWDFDLNSKQVLEIMFEEFFLKSIVKVDFQFFAESYNLHNEKLWSRFRNGFITREELRWKRMWHTLMDFKVLDVDLAKKMSERYLTLLPNQTALVDGAEQVLDYCKSQGYKLFLITNGFEKTQWQKLRNCSLESYFEIMICSEKANALKPHNAIFDFAEAKTQATKEESVIIGDSPEADILGGNQAGWTTVWYNYNRINSEIIPTFEIQHLLELKNIL